MNVYQDVVPKYPTKCEVEWVDAEDPLFLLYTSGSTGKPKVLVGLSFKFFFLSFFISLVYANVDFPKKGVLHTTGGYMVHTATTFKYAFDYKPSDVYWYSSDSAHTECCNFLCLKLLSDLLIHGET